MAALCWSSREKIPQAQGKRNPSKMVGVARGHQRANTLKSFGLEKLKSRFSFQFYQHELHNIGHLISFLIYFSSTPNEDNDWTGLQEWFPWNHWCQMLAQDWEHRSRCSVHSSSHPALSFPSLMFTVWFLIELWIRKCNTKGSHYY